MACQTYQSIREQLVTLSVEIDDRSKVCAALEEKVDGERIVLGRLEDDIKTEYTQYAEIEIKAHRDSMTQLTESTSEGMNMKKILLEQCKALVERVKFNEQAAAKKLRKIAEEVSSQLEIERKAFRSGQEGRQRKFLAEKLKGFEESTLHALEPEFSRLRMTAEQDLADISAKLSEDTRRMKSDMKTLYASKLSSEEKNLREDQRMLARVRLDEAVLEAEQLERVHKRKLVVMTEELTKSLDIFRNNLSQKVTREREESANELQDREKKYLDKMSGFRARHDEDIHLLQSEHYKKIREVRAQLERKKHDFLGEHMAVNDEDRGLDAAEEEILDNLKSELSKKRESLLKAEIRRIQTESAQAEKKCRASMAEERRRVQDARDTEEEQLSRKQNSYTNQIADLSVQKNKLSGDINDVLDELSGLQEELSSVKRKHREAEGVRIKVKQKRQDIEDDHDKQKRKLEVTQKAKLQSLWSTINELNLALRKSSKEHVAAIADVETKHEESLNELNSETRSEFLRKNYDLDCLRDAVQTEKVKMDKLKKLLTKYV